MSWISAVAADVGVGDAAVAERSVERAVGVVPEHQRDPAGGADDDRAPVAVDGESGGLAALADLGARPWQIEQVSAIITVAFLDPDPLPAKGGQGGKDVAAG